MKNIFKGMLVVLLVLGMQSVFANEVTSTTDSDSISIDKRRGNGNRRSGMNNRRNNRNRPAMNNRRNNRNRPAMNNRRNNRNRPAMNNRRPNRPNRPAMRNRPNRPNRPAMRNRPNRPNRPAMRNRPNRPHRRPGMRPGRRPGMRPGMRPGRRPGYRPNRRINNYNRHRPNWWRRNLPYSRYYHRPYRNFGYHARYNSPFYYYNTIPYRHIYWNNWLRQRIAYNNGFYNYNNYPYFVYNGYLHRYSNQDVCNYELVNGHTNQTVRRFHNQLCNVAYDRCSTLRDDRNYQSGQYQYFCSERVTVGNNNYNWNTEDDFYSDMGGDDYDEEDYDYYDE